MPYYIIYPAGDRSKLTVKEIDYDLYDYAVASRHSFGYKDLATNYAKKLAKENNKEYIPLEEERQQYLD